MKQPTKHKMLIPIQKEEDIFPEYRNTPIGKLLEYHNLGSPLDTYAKADLLIGMCMDNRKSLRIPENFAYIISSGGGNLRYSEFKVSYAIAIDELSHIALIGHNNCGMVNLLARKDAFIKGLVEIAGGPGTRGRTLHAIRTQVRDRKRGRLPPQRSEKAQAAIPKDNDRANSLQGGRQQVISDKRMRQRVRITYP